MEKKKKKSSAALPIVIVVAVVVVLAVIFVPKLVHECDNCGETFVGTGYEPNILSDALELLGADAEEIICKDCAESEHALAIATGSSVDDFKLPLFGESEE